jgi:prefoldin subunit 5
MASLATGGESKGSAEMSYEEKAKIMMEKDGNTAGIPLAVFIEDPAEFLKILPDDDTADSTAKLDQTLDIMQKLLQRYKFMEKNLANNLQSYKDKVPTISRALTAVKHLVAKKEAEESIDLHFNLANNVYSEAVVKPEGRVALWLGVNVMLEYSYEEALELLQEQYSKATSKLAETRVNNEFLREQIITTEVNIARIYNYGVKLRRQEKAKVMALAGK